jgi:hypothetical protein
MTLADLIAWLAAHQPERRDTRSLAVKADEVAQAMGWHG